MVRDVRVKTAIFGTGSLTATSAGLLNIFSEEVINGTIQSALFLPTTYTSTGSLLIFESGLGNSGTNLVGLLFRISGVSVAKEIYPQVYTVNEQGASFSGTTAPLWTLSPIVNSKIRIVGSGLGNGTSGLGLTIKYI